MNRFARQLIIKNVKKLRTSKGLNREQLSLALGFDNSYISKFERGKINISIDVLEQIANYFETDIKDLLS